MSRLRWSERASRDLEAIGDFIAADNPAAARAWVERLRERALAASKVPLGGRTVPEFGRDDIREVFLRTYRILYRVLRGEVLVLTILEGHRLLPESIVDEVGHQPDPPKPSLRATRVRKRRPAP